MPRFFFDVQEGDWDRDHTGAEFATLNQAISQAKRTLPAIALDHMARDADSHSLTMVVRDEVRKPVYTVTLSFSGMRLDP